MCDVSIVLFSVKIYVGEIDILKIFLLSIEKLVDIIIVGIGSYKFEFILDVLVIFKGVKLKSVYVKVNGNLNVEFMFDIIVNVVGKVDGEIEFVCKNFVKVIVVGGVFIIVWGEFGLSGEFYVDVKVKLVIK